MQGTRDLNPQPSVLETDALPVELVPSDGPDPGRPRPSGPFREGVFGHADQGWKPPKRECTGPRGTKSNRAGTGMHGSAAGWNDGLMSQPSQSTSHASQPRISARIGSIAESATLAVDAKAKALKAAGRPVIGFGAGEPDFPTPSYVVDAAVEACSDPANHRYTPAGGLPALKEAIAAKTKRDSGYAVQPSQVLVTNGGKQAVYEAFATLLDPGDEVLLPAPYWTTYPEAIRLAGGVPVEVLADETQDYLVTVRAARGRPDRPHEGAAVLLPVQPHGRRLLARAGRGDRPLGRRARPLGGHRRDLRAPDVRRRGGRVDAGGRAHPGRPVRRAERRGQDLRDDRLAGRLADRAGRRGEGRHQPAVARHLERRERVPAGG